jgi:hypothetical protein
VNLAQIDPVNFEKRGTFFGLKTSLADFFDASAITHNEHR